MASKYLTVAAATILVLLIASGLGEAGKKSKKGKAPSPGCSRCNNSKKAESSSEELDFKKLAKSASDSDAEELFLLDDRCTKQNSISQKKIKKCIEKMGSLLEFKENNRNCTCVGKKWKKCVAGEVQAQETTTSEWTWPTSTTFVPSESTETTETTPLTTTQTTTPPVG